MLSLTISTSLSKWAHRTREGGVGTAPGDTLRAWSYRRQGRGGLHRLGVAEGTLSRCAEYLRCVVARTEVGKRSASIFGWRSLSLPIWLVEKGAMPSERSDVP